jgi:N-acetylglutamate synthase-like GNAT family acetyltransferase
MDTIREHREDGFIFSIDNKRLNVAYIHAFLTNSYWAKGIPLNLVEQSIQHSLSFGVYTTEGKQVGFARVISDHTTFAYLADVFIDEQFRGRGLSKKLMHFIFSFDEFKALRRFMLATRDAHQLYAQFGFKPINSPEKFMEVHLPNVYQPIVQP